MGKWYMVMFHMHVQASKPLQNLVMRKQINISGMNYETDLLHWIFSKLMAYIRGVYHKMEVSSVTSEFDVFHYLCF